MAVLQISIQLDNVPGALTKLIDILDQENINAKAMLAASTDEISMVRLVVNDPEKAVTVLKSFNFKYEIFPVIAVEVPCHPGGMNAVVKPLSDGEINIHYIYTTIERIGKETIVILGVDKIDEATSILKRNWINFVGDRIYTL
jgi:hypothetical protein